MFVELPQNLILLAAGAFVLGWLLSRVFSNLGSRQRVNERDPRDVRIRELEAELRISKSSSEKSQTDVEKLEEELKETTVGLEHRDNMIAEQQTKIESIGADLKGSVLKTRELRAELTERATENIHAEAKIREVETELSVAQASTDMIATGVLDYSLAPSKDNTDDDLELELDETPESSKAGS